MPTPRQSARQLAEMVAEPRRALLLSRYWKEPLCRHWLELVDERVHDDPHAARQMAIIGIRLALRVTQEQHRRGIRQFCVLARAYGVLGSVYRAAGDLRNASRVLAKAMRLAKSCTIGDDRSDVLVRRAILEAYLAQRADGSFVPELLRSALDLTEDALRQARSPTAIARALNARGILSIRAGEHPRAARDARSALELLDPLARPYDHASAVSILVSALAWEGEAARAEASLYLQQLREALPQRTPAIRARLLWAEALLYVPNRRKKAHARRLLDQARRSFQRLGMRAEAIGTTADLARIDPAGAVPELCRELLGMLEAGPIRQLVERLRAARHIERVGLIDQLRAAIQAPGLLPAAVWPAP